MIKKEFEGKTITKNGFTVIIEDTPSCRKICRNLGIDAFEKKKKKVDTSKGE